MVIATMEIEMTHLNLPKPIAEFFAANERGGDHLARCFTEQGVVRDEGQTYTGLAAIAAWKTAAATKYAYTIEPLSLGHEDDRHAVTSRVSGNFPGSPAQLRFVFVLEREKIASLEIAP